MVYITEAHAIDGRSPNLSGPMVEEPIDFAERMRVAGECVADLKLPMPALVDKMDNKVGATYQGHPDRLYLVGKDGRIAYAGDRGPRGFLPDELEKAIQAEIARNQEKPDDSK